jgi:hypothetical protein
VKKLLFLQPKVVVRFVLRRIGFLRAAPPSERELEAFLRGLVDQGWIQGRNFVLVPQWGDGWLQPIGQALVTASSPRRRWGSGG